MDDDLFSSIFKCLMLSINNRITSLIFVFNTIEDETTTFKCTRFQYIWGGIVDWGGHFEFEALGYAIKCELCWA